MSEQSSANNKKVAVVTGANKGIGYHVALQLTMCNQFRHVILTCSDETRGLTARKLLLESATDSAPGSIATVTYLPLEVGNPASHQEFRRILEEKFDGKLDVLVNNAAIAFHESDPTPYAEQTKPLLNVNFRGTVDLTEVLLPLLRKSSDARIVNITGRLGRLDQLTSKEFRDRFSSPTLTMTELRSLVDEYEEDVNDNASKEKGWGESSNGMSKLALIAATKILAREEAANGIKVNCCCPGEVGRHAHWWCDTDMSNYTGHKPPAEGAKNAVLLATMKRDDCPTGEFYQNMERSEW